MLGTFNCTAMVAAGALTEVDEMILDIVLLWKKNIKLSEQR